MLGPAQPAPADADPELPAPADALPGPARPTPSLPSAAGARVAPDRPETTDAAEAAGVPDAAGVPGGTDLVEAFDTAGGGTQVDGPREVSFADPAGEADAGGPGRMPDGVLPGGLSLRLALRARPWGLAVRVLVAAAGAGTGYLLLAALAEAVAHHGRPDRLAWCALPLAAVTLLTATALGTSTRAAVAPAFEAVGVGVARLPLVAAAEAALLLVPGSVAALAAYLVRAHAHHAAVGLPVAAAATLLALVPMAGAVASAVALLPRRARAKRPIAGPALGLAAIVAGLAVGLYAQRPGHAVLTALPLPGGLGRMAPAVLLGWALVVAGPALIGPGVLHLTGRLLSTCRPGALRLLAGRALQADAGRLGRPLGALSAVVCAGVSGAAVHHAGSRPAGPLTALAAAILLLCPLLALACALGHARQARADSAALLATLGAAPTLLLGSALLRAAAMLAAFLPLTAALCWLAVPGRG